MRADRLLSILMLLQVHARLTTRELAERLEVSERTIHRDMDALSSVGVWWTDGSDRTPGVTRSHFTSGKGGDRTLYQAMT